jgi:hypothetical protein
MNYPLELIAALFVEKNVLGVPTQISFKYQSDLLGGRNYGTISLEAGSVVDIPFSGITQLMISKYKEDGSSIADFLPLFAGKKIIIAKTNDVNNFGVYSLSSLADHPTEGNFYIANVAHDTSNGTLTGESLYTMSALVPGESSISFLDLVDTGTFYLGAAGKQVAVNQAEDGLEFIDQAVGDKHYVYDQGIPSTTWSIDHNLGKYPSVVIVDTSNSEVIGDIQYIDTNNLTVTFSASFAGKAYLN